MLCPCCDCTDRMYTSRMSRHVEQSMKTPPLPQNNQSSSSWSSRVWKRVVCSRPIGLWVFLALGILLVMYGINDKSTRLVDINSALGSMENLKQVDESIDSTEQEYGRNSTNSSTLPIVYENIKITSLPPHVVNHHIVNMNGRQQLGQGEKIILVGMPKSGTTTVSSFFRESNRYSVCDFQCPLPDDTAIMGNQTNTNTNYRRQYIGKCMARAKAQNLPLIKTCGDYAMYGQLDYPMPQNKKCQLPQITLLQDFHTEHPDATFILNLRNASHWTSSVHRWRGMHRRLPQCALGPGDSSHISLRQWYYLHVQRIRQFVTLHPTHALVEIDVEHEDTGKRMEAIFGINETCWVSPKSIHKMLHMMIDLKSSYKSNVFLHALCRQGHRNAHPKKAKK